jgi:hypothetical protein
VAFRHILRKKGMNVTRRWNVERLKRSIGDPCRQPLEHLAEEGRMIEQITKSTLGILCMEWIIRTLRLPRNWRKQSSSEGA